jgi:hypothetical protein
MLERQAVADILAVFDDSVACVGAFDRFDLERPLLLDRLRRVRNALTHGNPVTDAVLQSVTDLSNYLAHAALQVALDSIASAADPARR